MDEDTQFGIFEIGMNHAGEISPLVKMVRPDIAVITNVEAAHLGAFANVEEIALAKAEIFDGVVEGGAVVLNRDNEYFELLSKLASKAGIAKIVSFGETDGTDVHLNKLKLHDRCSCMMASLFDEDIARQNRRTGTSYCSKCAGGFGYCQTCWSRYDEICAGAW